PPCNGLLASRLAEAKGFEPLVGCPTPVFKTGAFDHSATLPRAQMAEFSIPVKLASSLSALNPIRLDSNCKESTKWTECSEREGSASPCSQKATKELLNCTKSKAE